MESRLCRPVPIRFLAPARHGDHQRRACPRARLAKVCTPTPDISAFAGPSHERWTPRPPHHRVSYQRAVLPGSFALAPHIPLPMPSKQTLRTALFRSPCRRRARVYLCSAQQSQWHSAGRATLLGSAHASLDPDALHSPSSLHDKASQISEYNSCRVDHKNQCAVQTKPVLMGSRAKIGQSCVDPVTGRPSRKCSGCSGSRRSVSVLTTA
jgi:hypothetical protein